MRQLQTMGHKQHHTWMLFISLSLLTIGGVAALFTLKLTHWVYSWPFTLQHFPLKWSTSLKCITARMSALSELCLRLQPLKMHKKKPSTFYLLHGDSARWSNWPALQVQDQHMKTHYKVHRTSGYIIGSPITRDTVKMPGCCGKCFCNVVRPHWVSLYVCKFPDAPRLICSSLQKTYSQQYFESTGKCFTSELSWKTLSGTKTQNCCLSVTMMAGSLGAVCTHTH